MNLTQVNQIIVKMLKLNSENLASEKQFLTFEKLLPENGGIFA